MNNPILQRRQAIVNNIQKGFNDDMENYFVQKALETEIEKGEVEFDEFNKAVYADTYENRKLGRVGQEYHRGKGKQNNPQTNNENGNDKTEKQPQRIANSNRRVTKVGEKSELYENNGHKYITMHHGYGENKKSDFIKDVKAYLKSQGETFDPSKVTVKKEIGYDHYKHPVYTYTMSGNREEEEKMHSDHIAAKRKAIEEKVAAWKKNNETAEDILGAKAHDIITKYETHEENKERMDAADDLEYEKIKAKIAQRIANSKK